MTPPATPSDQTPVLSPVQRLELLLNRGVVEAAIQQIPTGQALATLVGLTPESARRNWSRGLIEVTNLIDEARRYAERKVETFEDSPYAKTFNEVLGAFSQMNLDAAWGNYSQSLRHLATIALPFVAHATDGIEPPPVIHTPLLTNLRKDLDRLLKKILASALPTEFKAELASSIEGLRDAIIRFHVYGPEGVARSTALVVGSVAINETAARSDAAVVKEAADIISKLQDVFLKSFKIGKIAAIVYKALSPGAS